MTVEELIEKLKEFDPSTPVKIDSTCGPELDVDPTLWGNVVWLQA